MKIVEGNYKGNPTLEFWDEDAKPGTFYAKAPVFSFGVKKAGIILDNIEAIKEFYQAHKEAEHE